MIHYRYLFGKCAAIHSVHYCIIPQLLATIIGACFLFYVRGWSIALAGDTTSLILQLLCILVGSCLFGLDARYFDYVIRLRLSDWPICKEDRQLVWATLVLVVGFLIFFVANVSLIVTTSPGTQGAFAYYRGGWVDFLYTTAYFILALGTLLVPMRIEQDLERWEEDGDEDHSGETAAIA